jgi:hypothetical protein
MKSRFRIKYYQGGWKVGGMSKGSMKASVAPKKATDEFAAVAVSCGYGVRRRRRISREAGKALEILGHAIDYLMDEFLDAGGSFRGNEPQLEAIRLMMVVHRQIYLGRPERPTLAELCRASLHMRTA